MFTLELYDRLGQKLNIGDIVKISDGHHFKFFAEVKYFSDEKTITPFGTFSFHSFEKVEKVPETAIQSTEERYKIWYENNPESDLKSKEYDHYLLEWRHLESLLSKKIFRIELNTQPTLF